AAGIRARWAEWEKRTPRELADRLEELRKAAQKVMDRQAELQKQGQDLSPEERSQLKEINAQRDLGTLEAALRQYEAGYVVMGKPKPFDPATERQRIRLFQGVISVWQRVLVQARDEQWALLNASWP